MICKKCGHNMQSRGRERKGKRKYIYYCNNCGTWEYLDKKEFIPESGAYSKYSNDGQNIQVSFLSNHIPTPEEVAKIYSIDLNEWEIKKIETTEWQSSRKDKQVDLRWNDGVSNGFVKDSGQFNQVWNHRINVTFVRKTDEIHARGAIYELKQDLLTLVPKVPKIKYPKYSEGCMYEIMMPDMQLGRLVLEEEAGRESNPDLYVERAEIAITDLLSQIQGRNVSRMLLPLGNDFFDSNTAEMTTVHGTPQKDDVRWHRTFTLGKNLMVKIIDMMMSIAPVDVLLVPGNHDEERVWHLGDTLESRYYNNPNVVIDNRPIKRKYYQFEKCLIGFTHGYYEKPEVLGALMPNEEPQRWANSLHREFHLGDRHHKKDMVMKTHELENGLVVRLFRSLAPPSVWEFDKALVGSLKAAEGLLWHPTRGVTAQFTSSPDYL